MTCQDTKKDSPIVVKIFGPHLFNTGRVKLYCMKPPQQNNRDPKSTQKASRKYSRLIRYGVSAFFILLGIGILGFVALRVGYFTAGRNSTVDKPVTDVLNMADQHKIKTVSISGNEILATGTNG